MTTPIATDVPSTSRTGLSASSSLASTTGAAASLTSASIAAKPASLAPIQPAPPNSSRHGPLAIAAAVIVFGFAPLLPSFYITLLNNVGLAALVLLGIVVLTGVAGMTSFGQAAFVGLGAYSSAWLSTALPPEMAWAASPLITLVVGVVVTLIVASILGAVTLRLSGHYLPLGTIAWGTALYFLFGTFQSLGGYTGLSGLPALHVGSYKLDKGEQLFYVIWGIVLLAMLVCRNLLDSRKGRAIRALNGGQAMAASMGVDVFGSKMTAFLLAATLASVSGWLYAYTQRFVGPAPFSLTTGIDYMFMILIGGVGHLWGALVGAGLFTLFKDQLQDLLPRLLHTTGSFESVVFGALIVWLMHRAPSGVAGAVTQFLRKRMPGRGHIGPDVVDAEPLPRRALPARGSAVLQAQGVTRRFGGLLANNKIDLTVHAGEILAVIGPNGAGKSTLFNQLSCVDEPTEGSVVFLGKTVTGSNERHIAAAGLSRTFQHVKLLPDMSVLENVAIGTHLRGHQGLWRSALRLDRAEEARLLAEAARMLERVGLGAYLHVDAGSLALGQQRLLEIARALCADPCVLLLDEPAAGLRHLEKKALGDLLRKLRSEGMAVLLVEHDMDFVMNLVDRVVVMVFGEKLTEGLPKDVQRDPRVLEAYLGAAT